MDRLLEEGIVALAVFASAWCVVTSFLPRRSAPCRTCPRRSSHAPPLLLLLGSVLLAALGPRAFAEDPTVQWAQQEDSLGGRKFLVTKPLSPHPGPPAVSLGALLGEGGLLVAFDPLGGHVSLLLPEGRFEGAPFAPTHFYPFPPALPPPPGAAPASYPSPAECLLDYGMFIHFPQLPDAVLTEVRGAVQRNTRKRFTSCASAVFAVLSEAGLHPKGTHLPVVFSSQAFSLGVGVPWHCGNEPVQTQIVNLSTLSAEESSRLLFGGDIFHLGEACAIVPWDRPYYHARDWKERLSKLAAWSSLIWTLAGLPAPPDQTELARMTASLAAVAAVKPVTARADRFLSQGLKERAEDDRAKQGL